MVDLYGSAGTCVLFNVAVLHSATTRPTTAERKSIQVYYSHTNRPHLSEVAYIPYAFWRDHMEPEARDFYSVFNRKIEIYWQEAEDRPELPLNQELELRYFAISIAKYGESEKGGKI